MDKDSYFLEVCSYVDLNPVRAKIVKRPPEWLDTRALHQRLAPRKPLLEAAARYANFVAQGKGVKLWEEAPTGQIYPGGETFVKRMQARITIPLGPKIARMQHRPAGRPLTYYFKQAERDEAIVLAYRDGGYTTRRSQRQQGCPYRA